MSLQDVMSGLFYVLHTWGPFAASEMSTCDFGILETANTCALVFWPGRDTTFEQVTFGASGQDFRHWSIEGAIYVKDTGDPQHIFDYVRRAHDDLYNTIRVDRFLNNTAANATLDGMSFDPNIGVEAGGHAWAIISFSLSADEYDG